MFRLWSNSEIKLGDPLNEIADAMEKNNGALKTLVLHSIRYDSDASFFAEKKKSIHVTDH